MSCLISSNSVRSRASWGQFPTCSRWRADHGSQAFLEADDVLQGPATLGEAGDGLPARPLGPGVPARLCTVVAGSSTRMLVPSAAISQGQPLAGQTKMEAGFPLAALQTHGE